MILLANFTLTDVQRKFSKLYLRSSDNKLEDVKVFINGKELKNDKWELVFNKCNKKQLIHFVLPIYPTKRTSGFFNKKTEIVPTSIVVVSMKDSNSSLLAAMNKRQI